MVLFHTRRYSEWRVEAIRIGRLFGDLLGIGCKWHSAESVYPADNLVAFTAYREVDSERKSTDRSFMDVTDHRL